jgi:hypothetical protein
VAVPKTGDIGVLLFLLESKLHRENRRTEEQKNRKLNTGANSACATTQPQGGQPGTLQTCSEDHLSSPRMAAASL